MIKSSQYVSLGHPDKVADFISCYLLDEYLKIDPKTRFAVEVQIKNNHVTLGGQITSKAKFTKQQIETFIKCAIDQIGYTEKYQKIWGKENTICGNDIKVNQYISQQSSNISVGVNNSGWGDQGIFWGMATNNSKTNYMPIDFYYAKKLGSYLYANTKYSKFTGLDIKTLVQTNNNDIQKIIIAIPILKNSEKVYTEIIEYIENTFNININKIDLSVNGTGQYIIHGPIADCGTTGRKLAVDFYGGNCRIGGGSPWTKDGTKADLTLNMYARQIALDYILTHKGIFNNYKYQEVHCAINCQIGQPEINVTLFNENMKQLDNYTEIVTPDQLIEKYGLNTPRFKQLCKYGLFSNI